MSLPPPPQTHHCVVLYGSQTGTAQDAAERIGRAMGCRGFRPRVSSLDAYDRRQLPEEPLVVFVVATTGDGDPPDNMKSFWKFLLRRSLPRTALEDCQVAVFGLGDSSYAKFNAVGRKLRARLLQLGAKELCERGFADEQSEQSTEGDLAAWMSRVFFPALQRQYPIPPGTGVLDRPQLLHPTVRVEVGDDVGTSAAQRAGYDVPFLQAACPRDAHWRGETTEMQARGERAAESDPILTLRLIENQRLTAEDWTQDVRHFTFDMGEEGFQYRAGDVLVLFPRNSRLSFSVGASLPPFRETVDSHLCPGGDWVIRLSHRMQWDPTCIVTLHSQEDPSGDASSPPSSPTETSRLTHLPSFDVYSGQVPGELAPMAAPPVWPKAATLGELLSRYVDIQGIPRRSAFEQLAFFATDEEEREKLLEIAGPEGSDLYFTFCVQEKRSWVEVLEEFPSIRMSLSQFLTLVPPLQPRSFSIASSYVSHGKRLELCVAVVNYRTRFGREKRGVCSSWLASLTPSASPLVVGFLRPGHLRCPPIPHPPLLLIGPGTGVAPMRAILAERAAILRGRGPPTQTAWGPNAVHLFFGCRHERKDFLYADEWRQALEDGTLTELHTAFSRDQRQKVYVQARIADNKASVATAILDENAAIYIAGSAKRMPMDVKDVLAMVLQSERKFGAEEAHKFVAQMEKRKRLIVEAWS